MLALRCNLLLSLGVVNVINFIIFGLSFYYFYHAIIFYAMGAISNFTIRRLGGFHYPVACALVQTAIFFYFILQYSESIFLHKVMLELAIGMLKGALIHQLQAAH